LTKETNVVITNHENIFYSSVHIICLTFNYKVIHSNEKYYIYIDILYLNH